MCHSSVGSIPANYQSAIQYKPTLPWEHFQTDWSTVEAEIPGLDCVRQSLHGNICHLSGRVNQSTYLVPPNKNRTNQEHPPENHLNRQSLSLFHEHEGPCCKESNQAIKQFVSIAGPCEERHVGHASSTVVHGRSEPDRSSSILHAAESIVFSWSYSKSFDRTNCLPKQPRTLFRITKYIFLLTTIDAASVLDIPDQMTHCNPFSDSNPAWATLAVRPNGCADRVRARARNHNRHYCQSNLRKRIFSLQILAATDQAKLLWSRISQRTDVEPIPDCAPE